MSSNYLLSYLSKTISVLIVSVGLSGSFFTTSIWATFVTNPSIIRHHLKRWPQEVKHLRKLSTPSNKPTLNDTGDKCISPKVDKIHEPTRNEFPSENLIRDSDSALVHGNVENGLLSDKITLSDESYKFVLFKIYENVAFITLNNPPVNSLSEGLVRELSLALKKCEENPKIRCTVLQGSEKVFSAGANIKEMRDKSYMEVYKSNFLSEVCDMMSNLRKPIFAAVRGQALGGGCELAQWCNFIVASNKAKFAQPEIRIGTIAGAGGTQFLPRSMGKGNAMYYLLTGRKMNAEEAKRAGLVSLVVPDDQFEAEVSDLAQEIASYSLPALMKTIEAVSQAYETSFSAGIKTEHTLFQSTFAHNDLKEGMDAFLKKRQPEFNNE